MQSAASTILRWRSKIADTGYIWQPYRNQTTAVSAPFMLPDAGCKAAQHTPALARHQVFRRNDDKPTTTILVAEIRARGVLNRGSDSLPPANHRLGRRTELSGAQLSSGHEGRRPG